MHRAFHALPKTLILPDGRLINAVYGFASFLINALRTEKPDYIAVTFDHAKKTVRHEEYAEYKGTRKAAPQEFYDQIPLIKKLIESFGIAQFEFPGFEADDLIATLKKRFSEEDHPEILIYSGDHDIFQLINDHTKVAYPVSGLNKVMHYDSQKIKERYGLTPDQIVDYKALAGDASDNLPGVLGIGGKTASNLLKEYGSLDKIYENLDKTPKKIREKLINGKENAFLSKRLATLIADLNIEYKPENLSTKNLSFDRVKNFFEKMRFQSLIKRLEQLEQTAAGQKVLSKQTSLF